MSYSIQQVERIDPVQFRKLAGDERFVTHAHNPCLPGILKRTFGWEGSAFIIFENNIPVGLISCVYIKGRLVSVPHFSFGGILSAVAERKSLYVEVLPLLNKYFRGPVSLRVPFMIRDSERISDHVNDTKVISWLDLTGKTLDKLIPGVQMAKVTKALASGLQCVSGGVELLPDFYKVYSRNMLRLGSPVLPEKLFKNLLTGYRDGEVVIFCVYKEKKPVGAAFLLSFMGFFENTWFSTLSEYNPLFPAQLLHYLMIDYSVQKAGHTYSFGRSTAGSGVHEFKRRWKTEEKIIYWNYDRPLKLDMRKAEAFSKIWRLLPLPIANLLGPFIVKRIY